MQSGRLTDAELEKVSREVELLERVNHPNIINFFAGWHSVDTNGRKHMDFITELMTSGTLKEFIRNAKSIRLKVIRRWSYNILEAIHYLHSFDPPIMHRDLKCDNIFINGNVGEVKIGDLGLSSVKEHEKALSVIGTPEFMAPELYEESYTEKVDIYAFGMCMLEMLTMEYPYGECQNPAQIFRKVSRGEKPASLLKFMDSEFKRVIVRCLDREEVRPSAWDLLQHPLFKCWKQDDGKLSNVDLVRAGNLQRTPTTNMDNIRMGDMYVHHSPNLERDVVISGRTSPHGQHRPFPTEKGVRIGLNVPVSGTIKKIEFLFDPDDDSPQDIANEMLLEFNLDADQVEKIRRDIEAQVRTVTAEVDSIPETMRSSIEMRLADNDRKGQLLSVMETNEEDRPQSVGPHFAVGSKTYEPRQTESAHIPMLSQDVEGSSSTGSVKMGDSSKPHNSRMFANFVALMDYCTKGKLALARQKLEQGTSPSMCDYDKRTPLHLAASENHADIVRLLLEFKANPDAKDRWGSTPMNDAIKLGHEEVIKALEENGVIRDDSDLLGSQNTASMELLNFCAHGMYDLVKERLMAGVSAQFADYDKRTPLHLAASEGHAQIAELLLVNGADMMAKDRFNRTPIDDALKNGHKEVLRVMKQYGAEIPGKIVEASNKMEKLLGMDLIDHAAKGRLELVKKYVENGADMNFHNYDRRYPLHLAVTEGHTDVVRYLLEAGASVNAKDRWGSTAYDEAVKREDKEIMHLLEEAGGLPGALLVEPNSPSMSNPSNHSATDSGEAQRRPATSIHNIVNIEALKAMSMTSD